MYSWMKIKMEIWMDIQIGYVGRYVNLYLGYLNADVNGYLNDT